MKRNLKIAIADAQSFLGVSTLDHLAKAENISEIRILYRSPDLHHSPDPKIKTLVGDLTDSHIARDLVHGVDAVFHSEDTSFSNDSSATPHQIIQNHLAMTGNLLEAMVQEKANRILFTSMGTSLYKFDPLRKVPHHEASEIEFRSPLALAKLCTEQLLQYYRKAHGISATILRLSHVFGKHQTLESADAPIYKLFQKSKAGEESKFVGNLDMVRDYVYVDDFLRLFDALLQRPEQQGIFNVGSGVGVSLREIVTVVEKQLHKKVRISFAGFTPTEVPWSVLNTSKVQRTFSWTCRHSIQDGIRLLAESLEEPSKTEAVEKIAA